MEPSARITVAVLSYNRRHYLREMLESLLTQTYQNFHILVVDDASPDGAGHVAQEYASRYPTKITAICKERNRGAVDSLNRFIFPFCRESDYIAIPADDDVWLPEKLERQMACFAEDPRIGLVFTDADVINAEGHRTGQTFSDMYGGWEETDVTRRLVLRSNFICGSSVVMTRGALASLDFHIPARVRFLDDHFMWGAISSEHPIRYIDEPLTLYRVSPGNVSDRYSEALVREDFEVRRILCEQFPGVTRHIPEEEARAFLCRYALDQARYSIKTGHLWRYVWFGVKALHVHSGMRTLSSLAAMARDRERTLLAEVAESKTAVQWLSNKVEEKEHAVQWLTEKVEEKEHAIQRLLDTLKENEDTLQKLATQVQEKVEEKEQAVQWLTEKVEEKEQAVQWLSEKVEEKEQAVQWLSEKVEEKEQAVQWLSQQVTGR